MTFVSNKFRTRALTGAALTGLMAAAATPVWAQEADSNAGLEEIVVTAQHREERLQDVPIAISAVSANALAQNGVDSSRDLPQIVPSVQFTRSGASGLFFVRGVGTTNAAVGEEGANAVYVDGVYIADLAQTVNNFNNIQRIEVLKGPQGTLFGRNATGGLIHIITREPGDETVFAGKVGYGNFETVNTQGYLATPLGENAAVDLAVTKLHQNNGWGRNLTLNRKNRIQDYWGARSKLVLRPTDTIKLVASGDYYKNADNMTLGYKIVPGTVNSGGAVSPAGFYDTTLNHYPLTRQKIWGVSLTGEADLGFATLTSVTAYRKTRNISDFDVDGGPADTLNIAFVSGGDSFQQEVRLASTATDPISWQAGAFFLKTSANNNSTFFGAAFGGGRQEILADLSSKSYAAFGEVTWNITPSTHLTGGIRYTTDRRHFIGSQYTILASGVRAPGATATTPCAPAGILGGRQRLRLGQPRVQVRLLQPADAAQRSLPAAVYHRL
jgi:iron complex outermembrane receptor protein